MKFFDKIGEWLYSNFSTEFDANAKTHEQVAIAQQERLDASAERGNVGFFKYVEMSSEITDAGGMTRSAQKQMGSTANLLSGVPWWVWALIGGAAFVYLGGHTWLKGILAKKTTT